MRVMGSMDAVVDLEVEVESDADADADGELVYVVDTEYMDSAEDEEDEEQLPLYSAFAAHGEALPGYEDLNG